MKNIFVLLALLLVSFAYSKEVPPSTLARIKKIYPTQSESFILHRLEKAPSFFDKWRSFPPYFYEMVQRSPYVSLFNSRKGLCAGDPHLENFGFIPSGNQSSLLTLNDMDDATTCSLDLDLMRLFISQKLLVPELKSTSFLANYKKGISGLSCDRPEVFKKLEASSIKKGKGLSKKYQAMADEKSCLGDFASLTDSEKKLLEEWSLSASFDKACYAEVGRQTNVLWHACSRTKDSGGSAGEKRFVLFSKTTAGVMSAIELKPLVNPAPDVLSPLSLKQREEQFKKAVDLFLGKSFADDYYPVQIGGKLFQRRPNWAGVESLDEEDFQVLNSGDKEEVLIFESCLLGTLHRRSNSATFSLDPAAWNEAAQGLEAQFRREFSQVP